MKRAYGYLFACALALALAGCSSYGLCKPNLAVIDSAKGALLGNAIASNMVSVSATETGGQAVSSFANATMLGTIAGGIAPALWTALVTSSCPTTIPVAVQQPTAQLTMIPVKP